MTEPQRLLDGGDELERELLMSAQSDAPTDASRTRAMAALGLGVTSSAVAGAALAAEASLPPAAKVASATGAGVLVKWLGLAVVAGALGWGALGGWGEPEPIGGATLAFAPAVERAALPAEEPALRQPDEAPAEVAEADVPVEVAEVDEPVEVDDVAAAPAPATAKPAAPSTGDLADEVAALDKARKALDDDPDAALEALEGYRKEHGGGVLAQEAEVLRIESLARAERHDEARRAGAAFLAKHASSPLAGRVRQVLGALP